MKFLSNLLAAIGCLAITAILFVGGLLGAGWIIIWLDGLMSKNQETIMFCLGVFSIALALFLGFAVIYEGLYQRKLKE